MARKFKKNTIGLIGVLSIIALVIVVTFGIFIYKYLSYDKTKYEVTVGSVVYDDDMNFIQIQGEAYITQKMDRKYYMYEEKDGDTYKYSLGDNVVVYKEGDQNIYLYGKAYQVLSSGDVNVVDNETKIVKSNPTKFFKLADRKYLIVDSSIRSVDTKGISTKVLDTKGYVIIDLDKQGNPSFHNNLVNFKTIAQLTLKGSNLGFDIANEVLVYNDKNIDLKNIIGSSNEYDSSKIVALSGNTDPNVIDGTETVAKIDSGSNGGGGYGGGGGGGSGYEQSDINNYYDEYLNAVIKSINNLTVSVSGVNENANASLSHTITKYYDFSRWVALKNVTSDPTSITVSYSIFDPSNEYQVVKLYVAESSDALADINIDSEYNTYVLDKDATTYTIRGLEPGTSYKVTMLYRLVGSNDQVLFDTIEVRTASIDYSIYVTKLSKVSYIDESSNVHYSYKVDYELNVDPNYRFTTADIVLSGYSDPNNYNPALSEYSVTKALSISEVTSSNKYIGTFTIEDSFSRLNVLKITNMKFCAVYSSAGTEINCSNIVSSDLEYDYKFFNE